MPRTDPRRQFFDYATVDPETRDWLRDAAAVFDTRPGSAVEAVEVGRMLAAAKSRLGHGNFRLWCQTECSWNTGTIWNLMRIGKLADQFQMLKISTFGVSTLYRLASPKLPDAARQTAIAEAMEGGRLTCRRIAELSEIASGKRKAVSKEERKERPPEEPLKPLAALTARGFDMIHIYSCPDDGAETAYHGRASNSATRETIHEMRECPEDLLLALAGLEKMRVCAKCKESKPLSLFSVDVRRPGGKSARCQKCERQRLGNYSARRRRPGARKSPEPPPSDER